MLDFRPVVPSQDVVLTPRTRTKVEEAIAHFEIQNSAEKWRAIEHIDVMRRNYASSRGIGLQMHNVLTISCWQPKISKHDGLWLAGQTKENTPTTRPI